MINVLTKYYLKVNYCGQKIGNKYFPEKGLVNIIMFEISFLVSGFLILLLGYLNFFETYINTLILILILIFLWRTIYVKLSNNIDFSYLEGYHKSLENRFKILYLIISGIIFLVSFLSMIYIPKIGKIAIDTWAR